MKSSEIRKRFLEFFKKRKHKICQTSSLIPTNDPSLLFTSAGMVPFKEMFLGKIKPAFPKAASSQMCFRTNDIEKIGYTDGHHTFFEMLGNFSFGEYFKKEAILWAWEFLTKELGLEISNLYASVYEEDDEAYQIWQQFLPKDKIIRLGEDSNFWKMAETGPCGPCSEILIDRGKEKGCGKPDCAPGCDCDRYLEIWNLVFTQFERTKDGMLEPLPQKNIDTGMGLERLSALVQEVPTNFDTDLLKPIIDSACELTDASYERNEREDISLKIISDHVRGIVFLIANGVLPSNEGRGYVLRRILRRAAKEGKLLNAKGAFLYKLCSKVVEIMGPIYPELVSKSNYISEICKMEEERFKETLDIGYDMINNLIENLENKGEKTIPGTKLFKLYDTYGFPLDLTKEIARERNFDIDEEGFKNQMERQKKIASKSWKGTDERQVAFYRKVHKDVGDTVFRGYEFNRLLAKVSMIIDKDNNIINEAKKGDEIQIVLSETPFYGESGGQVGDRGKIVKKSKGEKEEKIGVEVEVLDTQRLFKGLIVHWAKVLKGKIKKGDTVDALIDVERRRAIMRSHTATHLLQAALRKVLGKHVEQAGSLVDCDYLRFDFTHFSSLKKEQIEKIEELINEVIRKNLSALSSEVSLNEAKEMGAMALFGEKYSEKVRAIMISSEGWDAPEDALSIELCGGTHCQATGEIGLFKIVNEASIAAGVRRIEALSGRKAYQFIKEEEENLQSVIDILKVQPNLVKAQLEKIVQGNKKLKEELSQMKGKIFDFQVNDLLRSEVKKTCGITILSHEVSATDVKELRNFGDKLKDKLKEGIIVLGSIIGKKPFLVCMITDNLVEKKGLHAGKLIKKLAEIIKGTGGGRANLAQGGGSESGKLKEALVQVGKIVSGMVKNKT